MQSVQSLYASRRAPGAACAPRRLEEVTAMTGPAEQPSSPGDLPTHGVLRSPGDVEVAAFGPNRVAFVLGGADTGGAFSLTDFTMAAPPAPGPPPHVHEDADECVYVLEGTLEMGVGGDRLVGPAGSIMLAPRGSLHSLANAGPGPARFVVVLAPPGFEGFWREMSEAQARLGGPLEPATVRGLQHKHHMSAGGEVRRL
jgi:quercetin dioxygenase-like cupin family protein